MLESIKDESDDQTGLCHRFTKPAFAPEAEMVNTGAVVLGVL